MRPIGGSSLQVGMIVIFFYSVRHCDCYASVELDEGLCTSVRGELSF